MVVLNHAKYFVALWEHRKVVIGIVINESLSISQLLNTWSLLGRTNSNIFLSLEYILLLIRLHNYNEQLVGVTHKEAQSSTFLFCFPNET